MSSQTVDTAAPLRPRQLIGGEWVGAASGRTFRDLDPFTGELVAEVPAGGRDDALRAIDAAAAAAAAWAAAPPADRQRVFLAAAGVLERRSDEIVSLLARETGATFGFSQFQIGFTAGLLRQAAGAAYAPIGEILPSDLPGSFAMAMRRPVGVVGAIAPWNAALILPMRSIVAPLVFGNTVVLKPSELSPVVGGLLLGELFLEAGLPEGALNIVTHAPGEAAEIGDELVADRRVRRINFTGSTATGRRLAEAAGRQLKRVVLELGGHGPLLVLDDADLDYAVDAAAFGAFMHQGQVCMSSRRLIVDRSISEEFVERLVAKAERLKIGDPKEPDTIIGPLINDAALQMVQQRVDEAVSGGASLLTGGGADGPCFQPTLLTAVPPDAEFARTETFGPVASIHVVSGDAEAVAVANASDYGLASGIITATPARGLALAELLDSGIVHVNDQTIHDEPQMPFGGVKDSGFGRFGTRAAAEEFTELRWVTVQATPRHFPF